MVRLFQVMRLSQHRCYHGAEVLTALSELGSYAALLLFGCLWQPISSGPDHVIVSSDEGTFAYMLLG